MIDSINAERAKAGLSALAKDDNVMKRAQAWAQHLTIEFRHSTWSEVEEFANSIGVDANSISGGENIVGGCFVEDDPVKTDMVSLWLPRVTEPLFLTRTLQESV